MLCLFTKKKLDKKKKKHLSFSRSLISHLEHWSKPSTPQN